WYFGCFTSSLSMTGNDMLVGVGDSKLASLGMFLGLVANALLDPVFIFGWFGLPAMGIRGAAVATVLCQAGSMVYVITILNRRHKLLKFKRYPWEVIRQCWGRVISFAIPAALGMFMIPLGSFVVTRVTAEFGDAAVAAAQAAGKLELLAFMFPMSFGMSLTPLISQNFGARLYDRIKTARRVSMGFALLFLSIMAVIFYFLAPLLASVFSRDDEIRAYMTMYLRIIPWGFWAIEIHRFSTFIFTGCSRPNFAAALNIVRVLAMLIPFTIIAFFWLHTLRAVFAARLFSDIAGGIMGFCCARHLTNRLVKTSPTNCHP
ncbi:MAG: polysaccharide biosynthesis C-terminal domain-containing protein, partial [Victivallales bacterium]|nr:polysaccharide biosynthesis C-terminal domain-containing protein [Victivallales bacterium]